MRAFFAPAKRTRFLVALGLALLMATPAVMIWANKVQMKSSTGVDVSAFEARLEEKITQAMSGVKLPKAFKSSPEFAPFGGPIKAKVLSGESARGKLLTNLGHVSWDVDQDALIGRVPAGLRAEKGDVSKGNKGSLQNGLNYVQLSAEAISSRGLDAVMASLGNNGRIVGMLPDRTVLLYVEGGQKQGLRSNPDVERTRAFEPYNKIALDFGTRPMINKNEAKNPDIRTSLQIVPGLDSPALRNRIANLPGVSELTALEFGSGYTLRVNYKHLDKLAKVAEVMHIAPVRDFMLSNTESPFTTQMGSAEDGLGILPFTDAGVDGGGLADNGVCGGSTCTAPGTEFGKSCSVDSDCDGPRVNNGAPVVPPQIVSVLDNGISYDSGSFSQTATEPTTTADLGQCGPVPANVCTFGQVGEPCGNDFDCDVPDRPIGATHRKVHGIIAVQDTGTTCDAALSGAGTHGNVVAGAIAAAPSELGFFLTKAGIGASGEPRQAPMDGIASGARILLSDIANPSVCTVNSLVERGGEVTPGDLGVRLNEVIGNAQGDQVHVAVLPFGAPNNFSNEQFLLSNGTYNDAAVDIDLFAWNNRDFLVVMPVGNNGGLVGNNRLALAINIFPDFFNGTDLDDDGNNPVPIQTSAPSTAKNILAVGGSTADCFTFFGVTDCEGAITRFSSRGPASEQSLRMAPKITAPDFDLTGGTPSPNAGSVAVFRSSDNDNLAPVEAQLDEGNFGTSYASAYVAGLAAIVNDYFAQGFYPTGSRVDANRVGRISSSLALAAITASADFNEGGLNRQNEDTSERFVRRTRCLDVGTVAGAPVGIICNSEQGYGRAVGTNVLPLANWSNDFELHPVVTGNKTEYPAAGLLVWDSLATGEPGLDNTTTSVSHTFLVDTPNAIDIGGGTRVATTSNVRVSLAWLDRPGVAGTGGPLTNDLDLVLQSPGPDNTLDTGDDIYYIGNHYGPATDSSFLDQWSIGTVGSVPSGLTEQRNNTEGVHLTGDANGDAFKIATGAATEAQAYGDSQIHTGTWRVTVQRGVGGAVPGSLTVDATNEDTNGNGRLDAGEDTNVNGRMDLTTQPFALVIAGPVFRDPADAAPTAGPGAGAFPAHGATFDSVRYNCADDAVLTIQDASGTCLPGVAQAVTTFSVFDADGNLVETETGFSFTASGATCTSQGVPVRLGLASINNGILEVETGSTIVATYDNTVTAAVSASAPINCDPNLINSSFAAVDGFAFTQNQWTIGGGCDQDSFLDSGEVVTYGVALQNKSRTDDYADLTAYLTPTAGATSAVRVLDSPKNMGRMPGSFGSGAFFHIYVDPAQIPANPNDRWVEFTLNLDSLSKGVRIAQQSYTFRNALDSDWETLHYSTDYKDGGREVRDLNRNLLIDSSNTITETRERSLDPFLTFFVPDEDITFSSMFVTDPSTGVVNNILGEDLNNNNILDAGEERIPNNQLDRGILVDGVTPNPLDDVPWSLDNNDGGWHGFRHAGGNPTGLPSSVLWEHKQDRQVCGFQTAGGGACDTGTGLCTFPVNRIGDSCTVDADCNNFGIWKAGDGDSATPSAVATACDTHDQPGDSQTPPLVEFTVEMLVSPIIAKVHQGDDARGFPYLVEFQRFGMNQNIQTADGYAGGGMTIDNNVDDDATNCMLCGQIDQYYTRRQGGINNGTVLFRLAGQYFNGTGINPGSAVPQQRTFGPFRDENSDGLVDGGDSGFAGNTNGANFNNPGTCDTGTGLCTAPDVSVGNTCSVDSDCDSGLIQEASPDYLTYPLTDPVGGPPTPVPGVCDDDGTPCQVDGDCATGTCTLAYNTVSGPSRNFDASLIEYEGGFSAPINNCPGASCTEFYFFWTPGPAADRWQLGISFWAIESPGGNTDYGYSWDDAVFEWDESHPQHEAVLGATPACDRFNQPGQPTGGQCATLVVDRTGIYECDDAIEVTVYDAKCVGTCANDGSIECGAVSDCVSVGGACNWGVSLGSGCTTDADCDTGAGENCTADEASRNVFFVTDTDSVPVSTDQFQVAAPHLDKPFALPAVPGEPGLYRGNVILSTTTDDANHAFTVPGTDGTFTVYYEDLLCDGDRDSDYGEYDFANTDGDGVEDASDTCPQAYDPGQADDDGDSVGNVCDNCPTDETPALDYLPNGTCDTGLGTCIGSGAACTTSADCPPYCDAGTCAGGALDGHFWSCTADEDCAAVGIGQFADSAQVDGDGDGVGDVCDFDDADLDGNNNGIDPCPDVWGTGGLPAGEICGTLTAGGFGVTCDTGSGLCSAITGCSQKTGPCDTSTGLCAFGDETNPNYNTCTQDSDCSATCTVDTDCECTFDRDDDGVLDTADNCVLTPNGAAQAGIAGVGNQSDVDADGMGDACDTDCTGAVLIGKCRNAGVDVNGNVMYGPGYGAAYGYPDCDPGIDTTKNIPVAGWDLGAVVVAYTWHPQDGSSVCSTVNDDWDVDFVQDNTDNCPAIYNEIIVPGTLRQSDIDRDGLGDVCDPAGTFDDEFNGIPDDVVAFSGGINCRTLTLASLTILASRYQDLDGDGDAFPDTGETGRIELDIQNSGGTLTDATIFLQTNDSDVECISEPAVVVGTIPAGAVITVGDIAVPTNPGFTFTASNTLVNTGPPAPVPTVRFNITVVANETLGISNPTGFSLLADLDAPVGVAQVFTPGPNGIVGDADDGILSENFDIDKDGSGVFNVGDTWLHASSATSPGCPTAGDCVYTGRCSNAPNTVCDPTALTGGEPDDCPAGAGVVCYAGHYLRATLSTPGVNELSAVSCGGFDNATSNPACDLDPDVPMNWHFHCPNDATDCPNTETGTCVGGCSYATPVDDNGEHVISLPNSLHVGAHFVNANSQLGDTTHFRNIAGYQSAPMNLALFPRPGDLEMKMKHLARLMDNNGVGGGANEFQCSDCADVQIRIDTNDDPDIDAWGFWDKLAPFQSVYDKKGMAWSAFASYYCLFTPTDTGTAPPNPRNIHETMCFPLGLWSLCGSTTGTTNVATGDCGGTGIVEPDGRGVWLETKFNLAGFLGQRVEIRWIMESWVFDGTSSSYFELGAGWDTTVSDDGWWLDDIEIAGTVEQQVTPQADTRASVGGICLDGNLTDVSAGCNGAVDDGGTIVSLKVQDLNGNILDGITSVVTGGQSVRISAIDSQITGGCSNGIAEYQFFKNGTLVQDWGPKTYYLDAPEANVIETPGSTGAYQANVRCSTDFSCTSIVGGHIDVPVYSGEGGDSFFGSLSSPPDPSVGVLYNLGTGETTLNWWNPGNQAADLYRGTIAPGSKGTLATPFYILDNASAGAACYQQDVAGTPASTGSNYTTTLTLVADPNPGLGQVTYYIASGNAPGGGTVAALGCANPAGLDLAFPPPFFGCPAPGDPSRIVRQTDSGNLCP